MDKQARKLNTPKEDGAPSEAGSEGGSNDESDHEEKVGNVISCSSGYESMGKIKSWFSYMGMYVEMYLVIYGTFRWSLCLVLL